MLKPEQCKVGTKVVCRNENGLITNYGTIVRHNGDVVSSSWAEGSDCVWVKWYPFGDIQPIALRVIDLDTEDTQSDQATIDDESQQEREAVMLLLSLGYTITKVK